MPRRFIMRPPDPDPNPDPPARVAWIDEPITARLEVRPNIAPLPRREVDIGHIYIGDLDQTDRDIIRNYAQNPPRDITDVEVIRNIEEYIRAQRDRIAPPAAQFRVKKKTYTAPPKPPKWEYPNIFETLPLYEKITLKTPVHSMLTPVGVEEVRFFIGRRYGVGWSYTQTAESLSLEENVQNHVILVRGEEQKVGGKFINRLAKVLFVLYKVTVSEADKNDLNKILEQHWSGGEKFFIDRVDRIDWEAGAFGEKKSEEGSCWWYNGGLRSSRSRVSRFSATMRTGMCGGIRLWLQDGTGVFQGVGRVWYMRSRYGFPILLNGYGFTTMQWAAKLSRHFNVDAYKQVGLVVEPDIVVNNHIGIAFNYPEGVLKDTYRFNLEGDVE